MPAGATYRPYCLADRPNHVRILKEAASETNGFGVLSQATVSDTVEGLIADLDATVIVDCGAFADADFEGSLVDLYDTIERMNAEYGLIPDDIGDRLATDASVSRGLRLWQRGHPRWSFTPVAVAQGETPGEYAAAYWDCYQMGADHIAIGGLLEVAGERSGGHATASDSIFDIIQCIRSRHPRIWGETWTFALGCDNPRRRPRFADLGVQAADSKRWLFQYDQDFPSSRHDQLVDEVLQLARTSTPSLASFASADSRGGGRA